MNEAVENRQAEHDAASHTTPDHDAPGDSAPNFNAHDPLNNLPRAAIGNQAAQELPRLPFPPTVLAIAGCSGSGKTTLANELARMLGGLRFHLDDYYLDLGDLPLAERVKQNFDDPALIEVPLLASHIAALARGESIARPIYDFATYTRVPGQSQHVTAGRFLIVEGLFALHYRELLPYYNLRVYVDAPDALCFERRLKRDIEERGRTPEIVREQYDRTVRPTSVAYVRPSAANADLVVDGTGALDWKVERVITELRKRGLLAGTG
jgi:uridine kinase